MKRLFATLSALALAATISLVAPSAALATAPSDAVTCGPGTYSATGYSSVTDGVTCVLASAGSFVADPGATSATPCPAGSFQSGIGQMYCTLAAAGKYVPDPGSVWWISCPAGTYQANTGSSSCDPAPAGRFTDVAGAAAASPCEPGTFMPFERGVSCLPAIVGTYVDSPGAVAAVNCPTGFTTAGVRSISVTDCSVSTAAVPAPISANPVVTPSPTPSPENTHQAEPTPIAMPVVMPAPAHSKQIVANPSLPTKLKVKKAFKFSAKNPSGLTMKASVSGSCSVSTNRGSIVLTATNKPGACNLKLTNAGNATYKPLAAKFTIKVTR